ILCGLDQFRKEVLEPRWRVDHEALGRLGARVPLVQPCAEGGGGRSLVIVAAYVSREPAGFQPADVCNRNTVMTQESAGPQGARTVLTTGANSGIGIATVLELARCGFRSVGSVRSAE